MTIPTLTEEELAKPARDRGLHVKYDVFKAGTDEAVHDCIVLRPTKDLMARFALAYYAYLIQPIWPRFSEDLRAWLHQTEDR